VNIVMNMDSFCIKKKRCHSRRQHERIQTIGPFCALVVLLLASSFLHLVPFSTGSSSPACLPKVIRKGLERLGCSEDLLLTLGVCRLTIYLCPA